MLGDVPAGAVSSIPVAGRALAGGAGASSNALARYRADRLPRFRSPHGRDPVSRWWGSFVAASRSPSAVGVCSYRNIPRRARRESTAMMYREGAGYRW